MADYTTITDAQVDPEAPITSELMSALRDNPIAISEGSTGAPKVRTAALQPPAAGTTYLIMRLQDAQETREAGNTYRNTGYNNRYDEKSHLGVVCLVAGTITAYGEHASFDNTSYLRVLKNGSTVAEWTTTQPTFSARSVNISVAVGDNIIFQQRTAGGQGGDDTRWRNLRIYSSNPDFAVA